MRMETYDPNRLVWELMPWDLLVEWCLRRDTTGREEARIEGEFWTRWSRNWGLGKDRGLDPDPYLDLGGEG